MATKDNVRAVVVRPFNRSGEPVDVGSVLEVPRDILPRLSCYVAWIDAGELRTLAPVSDLARIIVLLTADDLPLRQHLLQEHVRIFDPG